MNKIFYMSYQAHGQIFNKKSPHRPIFNQPYGEKQVDYVIGKKMNISGNLNQVN